jgi:hypothetical protein
MKRPLLFSTFLLVLLGAGLSFWAIGSPAKQAQRYQALAQQWHMSVRGDGSTDGQQRTGISKVVWFGPADGRRQMLLEAQSGQFRIVDGRLVEQLTDVHGLWQERFTANGQLVEEFQSPLAHYDYGRRDLNTEQMQLARWLASGKRLEQRNEEKRPLMNATADAATVHLGSPPRVEAQALKAQIFQ